MKRIIRFWDRRSGYEKAILGLTAAFVVFFIGYFSRRLYDNARCDICRQSLRPGEHYILDVRTGEMMNIADYVDAKGSDSWQSEVGQMPQEVSVTDRAGYMRFPREGSETARYCADHTANLDSDFLVLSPTEKATVCYALLDGRNLDPAGRVVTKRYNEALNCWELEILWD